jgi:hypothetical protein
MSRSLPPFIEGQKKWNVLALIPKEEKLDNVFSTT